MATPRTLPHDVCLHVRSLTTRSCTTSCDVILFSHHLQWPLIHSQLTSWFFLQVPKKTTLEQQRPSFLGMRPHLLRNVQAGAPASVSHWPDTQRRSCFKPSCIPPLFSPPHISSFMNHLFCLSQTTCLIQTEPNNP